MRGHIGWMRWMEHLLAVGGLAWLANITIEALSLLVERQRATPKLDREVQEILRQMEGREQVLAFEKIPFPPAGPSLQKQQPEDSSQLSEAERLKRQLALIRWGTVVAWQLSNNAKHREALAELYTRASRSCLQSGSGVTLEELRRITESASRRQARPADFSKGLLYDLAAMYFQSCRVHADCLAAAAVVPMLMEEHLKTPEVGAEELLSRWRIRIRHELDVYQPSAGA